MLPKIPYSMDKNKSVTVPIGNLNLSSNFKAGDIADSYGISARRYPQLTNSKDKSLVYTGGNILGMTVFNGEIVTARNDNGIPVLYIGNEAIEGALNSYDYDTSYKRSFAGINTKLTVYPDQIYLEKVDGEWKTTNLAASVTCEAVFGANFIKPTGGSNSITGYGGQIKGSTWSGNLEFTRKLTGEYVCVAHTNTAYISAATKVAVDDYIRRRDITVNSDTITIKVGEGRAPIEEEYELLKSTLTTGRLFVITKNENGADDKVYAFKNIKVETETTTDRDYYKATFVGDFIESESDEMDAANWNNNFDLYALRSTDDHEMLNARFATFRHNNPTIAQGIISTKTENVIKVELTKTADVPAVSNELYVQCRGWNATEMSALASGNDVSFDGSGDSCVVASDPSINKYTMKFEVSLRDDDGSAVKDKEWDAAQYITVTASAPNKDAFNVFKKGDGVEVSSSSFTGTESGETKTESNDIVFVISDIIDGTLYASADIFTPHEYNTKIKIERKFPDLDFICEKDNRLYGVNNSEKTIYVSALGDPTNMYAYEGVSTDSFAVAVGGEGNFTGCCKYAESVLFFKEDKIYKLVGSYPAEFALYSYDVDGLESGSEKCPVVINEVLYYKGKNGVFAYTGGIPSLISENFGEKNFSNAAGGSDGVCYYLAAKDEKGTNKLLSFNTRLGLWVLETTGGDEIIDFAKTSSGLHYATSDGEVYKLHGSENVAESWMVQFVPFYETIEGKKTYSRLLMRAELPKSSYMIIEVRSDDGPWCEAGKIVGANKGIIPIRLPIARCDKFEIRLRGKGEFVLHDILREYHVGSEV